MSKIRLFIVAIIWFFSATGFARSFFELRQTRLLINEQNVQIHGYYFPGAKNKPFSGTPVILPHGLSSNLHEFEYLIPVLVEAGFDCYAYNFRGHGNGDEQSTVLDYEEGDYQLFHMAETDFPLMVAQVIQHSGRPPHVLGHSMGGMVPRAAVAHGQVDNTMIQSMILIGSPPHFHGEAKAMRLMDRLRINSLLRHVINSGSGNDRLSPVENAKTMAAIMDGLVFLNPFLWAPYLTSKFVVKKVMFSLAKREIGPIEKTELSEWSNRATTQYLPKDILRSFDSFTQDGYPYENIPLPVPVMHIMGKKDSLVAWRDIVKSAQVQSDQAGHWLIRVNGIGHLGLVAPWVIEGYAESVFKFLRDPHSLGPKNKTFLEFSPKDLQLKDCSGLLAS